MMFQDESNKENCLLAKFWADVAEEAKLEEELRHLEENKDPKDAGRITFLRDAFALERSQSAEREKEQEDLFLAEEKKRQEWLNTPEGLLAQKACLALNALTAAKEEALRLGKLAKPRVALTESEEPNIGRLSFSDD